MFKQLDGFYPSLFIITLYTYYLVCRSPEEETSVEPTAESTMEEQEVAGRPPEAEPPLVGAHGMSFWMFIVVRL